MSVLVQVGLFHGLNLPLLHGMKWRWSWHSWPNKHNSQKNGKLFNEVEHYCRLHELTLRKWVRTRLWKQNFLITYFPKNKDLIYPRRCLYLAIIQAECHPTQQELFGQWFNFARYGENRKLPASIFLCAPKHPFPEGYNVTATSQRPSQEGTFVHPTWNWQVVLLLFLSDFWMDLTKTV